MRQLTVDRTLKTRPETAGARPHLYRSRAVSRIRNMMPALSVPPLALPPTERPAMIRDSAAARDRRMETLASRRIRPWPW